MFFVIHCNHSLIFAYLGCLCCRVTPIPDHQVVDNVLRVEMFLKFKRLTGFVKELAQWDATSAFAHKSFVCNPLWELGIVCRVEILSADIGRPLPSRRSDELCIYGW